MHWLLVAATLTYGDDIRELKLKDWQPRSMMVTKTTYVERPAFPVIDIHNHLGTGRGFLTAERVKRYLAEMDAAGVKTVVNLDGNWDAALKETIAALDRAHPGRFVTFANIDFGGIDDVGWRARESTRLEESFKAGARGLKFYKWFGLGHRYKTGKLVPIDDSKLNPIWDVCAKYRRPVLIPPRSRPARISAFFHPSSFIHPRLSPILERILR